MLQDNAILAKIEKWQVAEEEKRRKMKMMSLSKDEGIIYCGFDNSCKQQLLQFDR